MKNLIIIILATTLYACATGEKKTEEPIDNSDHSAHTSEGGSKTKSKSPKQMVMTNVGKNHVHIEYHSPSKRGRQIFGGLVAYGEVWVTGAHDATSIRFSKSVEIGGVKIPEGKYALFTIPGESDWTVIINKNWNQHLADEYDKTEDLVRFNATPQKLDESVESLTYEITAVDDNTGTITISWDAVAVSFDVVNM